MANDFEILTNTMTDFSVCRRVVTAGRQLARSLELQSLNDLGFSKRYVRCLQVIFSIVYESFLNFGIFL